LAASPSAATRLVILDGRFISALSSKPPEGVSVVTLGEDARAGRAAAPDLGAAVDGMLALNGALAQGGCVISVAAGATVSAPIEVLHWTTSDDRFLASRVAVEIGANAQVSLVEHFEGLGAAGQRDVATILDLGASAVVDHTAIVEGEYPDASSHLSWAVAGPCRMRFLAAPITMEYGSNPASAPHSCIRQARTIGYAISSS